MNEMYASSLKIEVDVIAIAKRVQKKGSYVYTYF